MNEDWLTVGEAARFLGVSDPTLRKWTDCGFIEAWRTPGRHRRYLLQSLISFRDARVEKPVSDAESQARRGMGS